jgi:hypothetical protein
MTLLVQCLNNESSSVKQIVSCGKKVEFWSRCMVQAEEVVDIWVGPGSWAQAT